MKMVNEIIELLQKNNITVTEKNIKMWRSDPPMTSIRNGVNYVKSIGNPILIFNRKIKNKEYIELIEKVTIYDLVDLKQMSIECSDLDLWENLDLNQI